jgi:hypothetical protein
MRTSDLYRFAARTVSGEIIFQVAFDRSAIHLIEGA